MAIHLELDQVALHQVGMDFATELVERVTRGTFNRSAVLCPVDTGRLRASGTMNVAPSGSEVVGEVVYDADYAAAVHNGSPPRTIVPRSGRYLRFEVGGTVVFARVVHHPGTPARPFLSDALEEVAGAEGFEVVVTIG